MNTSSETRVYELTRIIVIDAMNKTGVPLMNTENLTIQGAEIQPEIILRIIHDMTNSIIDFAKMSPNFLTYPQDVQITLLKSGARDVTMFWMARKCDVETNSLISLDNKSWSCEQLKAIGFGDIFDGLQELNHFIHCMKMDVMEYALLSTLPLHTENMLMDIPRGTSQKLKEANNRFMRSLQNYITTKYGQEEPQRFTKLISILPKLRLLSHLFHEELLNLKSKNCDISELIRELWLLQ